MKSASKSRPSYSIKKKNQSRPRRRTRYDRSRSGGRSRRRSRTRSRTRSHSPRRPRRKNPGFNKKKKRNQKNGEGPKKEGKSTGEFCFTSPASFEEATTRNFFITQAISDVEILGLPVKKIPDLHTMALGGRLKHCVEDWERIGISSWVRNVVSEGYKIPLKFIPTQSKVPANPPVKGAAFEILATEAIELLAKEAVEEVVPAVGQYISTYFAVPKARSPGKFRPILNLKKFNRSIKKYKFKMETMAHLRDWLKPGAYCVGIDLKDAFLHVPISPRFRKFLRFHWLGKLLQWIVLPFGLKCSPRILTKVLKPVIAFLRSFFIILITIYLDDLLIQASTPQKTYLHGQIVALLFMVLGWSINWKKSSFIPSQQFTHLGFDFDTVTMTISCPLDKVRGLQLMARNALTAGFLSAHDAERLLGKMESVRPATPLAALHYRPIQRQLLSLKSSWPHGKRRPKQVLKLSEKSLSCLSWWISRTGFQSHSSAPIRELAPTVEVWTDANLEMCGAHNSRGQYFQRSWTNEELDSHHHINLLETRAAREGLAALTRPGDRIRLHMDSTTAVSYIRRQGGTRSHSLSQEAVALWKETVARDTVLLTPHWLSTKENLGADFLSRHKMDHWEVMLDRDIFKEVVEHFMVYPTLDAFASSKTAQMPRFMSWYPESRAVARDALLAVWDPVTYLFPPIPLMMRVLQEVQSQGVEAILICPRWPSALWWTLVTELLVDPPLTLSFYLQAVKTVDGSPVKCYLHPLVACHISGTASPTQ